MYIHYTNQKVALTHNRIDNNNSISVKSLSLFCAIQYTPCETVRPIAGCRIGQSHFVFSYLQSHGCLQRLWQQMDRGDKQTLMGDLHHFLSTRDTKWAARTMGRYLLKYTGLERLIPLLLKSQLIAQENELIRKMFYRFSGRSNTHRFKSTCVSAMFSQCQCFHSHLSP